MSAQFIISRPLTSPVYGPGMKKAHSQRAEKGQQSNGARVEYSIRGFFFLVGGLWRGWMGGGEEEEEWSCVPVLHLTLLISC